MATPPHATGWPFLVAPGRRRDYAILLAPDFLVADLDHGILEHVVRPAADGAPATVVETHSGHGRRLTVVSATHLLTTADIAADGTTPAPPRDEHGRPLRLVYGFASLHSGISEPAEADLRTARERALEVYRRFLHSEERAGVVPSQGFELRTRTAEPVTLPASTSGPRNRSVGPLAGVLLGAAAAGVTLTAIALGPWSSPPAPLHTPCPATTRAGRPVTTPVVPSPSCDPAAPPSPAPAASRTREENPPWPPSTTSSRSRSPNKATLMYSAPKPSSTTQILTPSTVQSWSSGRQPGAGSSSSTEPRTSGTPAGGQAR